MADGGMLWKLIEKWIYGMIVRSVKGIVIFFKTVDLSVRIGITPNIMRGKIKFPDRAFRKMENWTQHSLKKLRIIKHKKWRGRVGNIYGSDTAVRIIFF